MTRRREDLGYFAIAALMTVACAALNAVVVVA